MPVWVHAAGSTASWGNPSACPRAVPNDCRQEDCHLMGKLPKEEKYKYEYPYLVISSSLHVRPCRKAFWYSRQDDHPNQNLHNVMEERCRRWYLCPATRRIQDRKGKKWEI
eukprot:1854236-Pyramimonas_sp.AAC.1